MVWWMIAGYACAFGIGRMMGRKPCVVRCLYGVAAGMCVMMTIYSIRHEMAIGVWRYSLERTISDERAWNAGSGTALWLVLLIVCLVGAMNREGSG